MDVMKELARLKTVRVSEPLILESNQSKDMKFIKESLQTHLPTLEEIGDNTGQQVEIALEQIEQLKQVNTSLEEQIKDTKSSAAFAQIIAILSLLFAIVSCFK